MSYPSRFLFVIVCLAACLLVSVPVWAQGSPLAYFSTGSSIPSQIYSMDDSGTATLIAVPSATDYEGLVVLPDSASVDTYSYLVYACNTAGDQIIRFNPAPYSAADPLVVQTIYSGGGLHPQCGRGTAGDDLIVTSTNKGKTGGWFEFAKIAFTPLTSTSLGLTPTQLFKPAANSSSVYEGTAMKNIGDLLIVDQAGNQVLRSPGPISTQFSGGGSYTTVAPVPFISGLSRPLAIARATTGEIFLSNGGTVMKFDAQGQNGTACVKVNGNATPQFLQMSLNNTLFIGVTKNKAGGELLEVDANQDGNECTIVNSFPSGVPVVGIALPPNSATAQESGDGAKFSFALGNSAVFNVVTGGSCTATPYATASEISPFGPAGSGAISALIGEIPVPPSGLIPPENGLPNGGTPAVDLWADGFQVVFDAHFSGPAPDPSCSPVGGNGGAYEETLSSFVDPGAVPSGTIAYCDSSIPSGCDTVVLLGSYPYGGLLPADSTGFGRSNSRFLLINATALNSGQFCGYESPFNGTAPPGIGDVFGTGSTISVKFKLATSSGNCKNGPYIQTAQALISVAQLCTPGSASPDLICSPNGQMPLVPSDLVLLGPEGNSTPTPPIFKFGNNQYEFSMSLKGYQPGIYSLTTTFLTGETASQTVLFQVQ